MKIVVLDDDPFFLNLIRHQLARASRPQGAPDEILAFVSPEEALTELAQAAQPTDLFICDLQIPAMDGIEVLRQLKHLNFGGRVALVSGEGRRTLQTAHQLAASHGLKIAGALEKPFEIDRLSALLDASPRLPQQAASAGPELTPEDLQRALDSDAVINHYQPQIDLGSGHVVGMEALVRWDHPQHGVLAPSHFVGIAETAGLMPRLTDHVVQTALAEMASWMRAGYPWRVSVNLSTSSLVDLDLPDRLAGFAAFHELPLERLGLELTEGQIMGEPSVHLDVLARLRLKRASLSIDDFGTEFSSMTRLRDLPFDELKIDRSFVHGISDNPDLQALVSASVNLARELGMKSLAEGVETQQDLDQVRLLGCDLAQGYFIAKPMHPRLLGSWYSAWVRRARDLFP